MKKLITLAVVSGLVLSVPAIALGQAGIDTGVGVGAGVNAGVPGAAAGAGATTGTGAGATVPGVINPNPVISWDQFMSNLSAQASADAITQLTTQIGGINALSKIQFVDIWSLDGGGAADARSSALQAATRTNAQAMTSLHTAINANVAFVDLLRAQGYSPESVVAITAAADGGFMVFVNTMLPGLSPSLPGIGLPQTLPAPAEGAAGSAGAAAGASGY